MSQQFDRQLSKVAPGDPVTAAGANQIIDDLNELKSAFAANYRLHGLPPDPQRPPAVRFRVSALPTDSPKVPYAFCRGWDGTNERTGDVAVRLTNSSHAVGDELNAYAPAYGTDAGPDSNGNAIVWYEVGGGGSLPIGQYQGQVLTMVSVNQVGFSDPFMTQGAP